jgi:hypothetical protein
MKKMVIMLLSGITLSGAAVAAPVSFNAADHGWYAPDGSHMPANKNTYTGGYGTNVYNSFYNFELGTLPAGKKIKSASITFIGRNGSYVSGDASETLKLWDVTTVPGLGNSVAVYQDLMSGTQYGEAIVHGVSNIATRMPEIIVQLNAAALFDMSDGGFFSIGAQLASMAPNMTQVLWSGSGTNVPFAATLNLELESASVPEPSSMALFGIAVAGIALARRRKGR